MGSQLVIIFFNVVGDGVALSLNWVFNTGIARLQFVDVAVTKQMRVADQFLAVEGCQHAMVKRLLVFG